MDHRLRPYRQWRIGVSPVNRFGGRRAQRGGFTTEAQRGEAAIRRQAFGTRWLVVSFRMAQHVVSRYNTFAETF
jgi:hypothetical protein